MNKICSLNWILLAGAAFLVARPVCAMSPNHELTPANLSKQPFELIINIICKATAKGDMFVVVMKHRKGVPYHYIQPLDGILYEPSTQYGRSGHPLRYPITSTRLKDWAVTYRFTLPASCPKNAQFQFGYTGYDSAPSMPVGDFYLFQPSLFAHQKLNRRRHHD